MRYNDGVVLFWEKLGTHKIMALASSVNDMPTVRNVSCIFYGGRIYFKTDREFRKTKQLLQNPNVALSCGGVQVEGSARNTGLVIEEPGCRFESLYEQYWADSYNAYPHKESEILIEVTPRFVEIWDQEEDNRGFQVFVDFREENAWRQDYD